MLSSAFIPAARSTDRSQGEQFFLENQKLCFLIPTGLKADRSEASKVFFFEKKKQKTFDSAVADLSGKRATAESKVFWSFFSKKDCLLSTSSTNARESPRQHRQNESRPCFLPARGPHESFQAAGIRSTSRCTWRFCRLGANRSSGFSAPRRPSR